MKRAWTLAFLFAITALSSSPAALDPTAVRAASAYSAGHRGASLLILQNGKTLYASSADKPGRIYSGTKAFWCLAALAAVDDGVLDLDERVAETIPAWRKDPRKAQVTIRQLLDFSCGLAPGFRLHADDPGDRDAIAIGLPIVAAPGSAFIYGPSPLQVFHAVLKAKLRGKAPRQYLERRVLRRLGLGRERYLQDRAGNPLLASGWILSARQWAKLGQLVLRKGAPVVSAETLAQSWRGSPPNRAYSLGWWNNRAAPGGREFDFESMLTPQWPQEDWSRACICRDAPSDLVMCVGSLYQRLYVVPSLDLIVVRHGRGGSFSDGRFLRLLLLGRDR